MLRELRAFPLRLAVFSKRAEADVRGSQNTRRLTETACVEAFVNKQARLKYWLIKFS